LVETIIEQSALDQGVDLVSAKFVPHVVFFVGEAKT
jgi:hypothetical protein